MSVKKLLRKPIRTTLIATAIFFVVFVGSRMAQLSFTRIEMAHCQDKARCYPPRDFGSLISRQILNDATLISRIGVEVSLVVLIAQLVLRAADKRP